MHGSPSQRSPWQGGLEFILIVIAGVMLASLGERVLVAIARAPAGWPIPVALAPVTLGLAVGVLSSLALRAPSRHEGASAGQAGVQSVRWRLPVAFGT